MRLIQIFSLLAFFILFIARTQAQTADLVITDAQIVTMDESRTNAEAVAIKNDRILAVGSDAEILKYIGPGTKKLELDGQFVTPGFIEGHAHFLGLGESLMMLRLAEAETWKEIVQMVAAEAEFAKPGEWIIGRGWHQSKWKSEPQPSVEGYPTSNALSKLTPNNPVLLTHASGHMSLANDYAMRLAGVNKETKNPAGGEILHDEQGNPTGVFRETAAGLISRALARDEAKKTVEQKNADVFKAIELASTECLKYGITSFQDAGTSVASLRYLKLAADNKQLGVRLWVMIRDSNDNLRRFLPTSKRIGYANQFLTVRAVKRSIDGALGPHGAWLLAPYSDMPTSSGLNTATIASVTETAQIAIANGYQVCVHAIGDRANREVLDIYEKMFQKHPSNFPRRWRIEHAQHLDPQDIPRFGKLGVIASMQGVHCTSDAVFVPQRLGMRRSGQGAYVWKSLLEAGAIVTNGTDAPVESIDPIASFYASVTRRLTDDVTFFPEQCMSRMQALRSYTIDCAYAGFEESEKGSIVPGKLADLTVFSQNLLTCRDEDILDTKVVYTIVGGNVVYRQPDKQ